MVSDPNLLHDISALPKPIHIGLPDGTIETVNEIGKLFLTDSIELQDVLIVPGFQHNLLSVIKLSYGSNLRAIFDLDTWCLQDRGSNAVVMLGEGRDGLYKVKLPMSKGMKNKVFKDQDKSKESDVKTFAVNSSLFKKKDSLRVVHARLGHTSLSKLKHVFKFAQNESDDMFCETCVIAKHHRLPFARSNNIAEKLFDLIHIDLWGPYRIASLSGDKFFLTILDDHSRVTWTFLLKDKTQVYRTISDFIAYVDTQFNAKIKCIRSDNGTEIVQHQCKNLFASKGIVHQKSAPYTPQQNGRVERKHRHLLETARAIRIHSGLPIRFWGECVLAATHVINKLPSSVLDWDTPFERLFHQKPSYSELRVIGCLCFASPTPNLKDKFEAKAHKCVLLGYPYAQKAYKLYDLETHKIFIS